MGHRAGKGHSLRHCVGPIGLAAAITESATDHLELALVGCGCAGCAGSRMAAGSILYRRAAWHCLRADLACDTEAGCELSAGGRQLGFVIGLGGCALWPPASAYWQIGRASCRENGKTPRFS